MTRREKWLPLLWHLGAAMFAAAFMWWSFS